MCFCILLCLMGSLMYSLRIYVYTSLNVKIYCLFFFFQKYICFRSCSESLRKQMLDQVSVQSSFRIWDIVQPAWDPKTHLYYNVLYPSFCILVAALLYLVQLFVQIFFSLKKYMTVLNTLIF